MDRKGFRIASEPDLVIQPPRNEVKQETMREIEATKTTPVHDSRFRGYAAPMEDGRLITDYRQRCVTRAPPGTQFAVKEWLIRNTDKVIQISRDRQVQSTGHALGVANTDLPAAMYQHCSPSGCQFTESGYRDGIGLERMEKVPELFGTFTFPPNMETIARDRDFTSLNSRIEYGRNTWSRWSHLYQ